jgi:metal-dependent amidase/aminoacylase/carboxypeptidase family protein
MRGTLRSFDEGVREILRRRVREILEGTAQAAGCRLEFKLLPGFPAVVNDPAAVTRVRRHAASIVGEANVVEPPPIAASEDFAYFLRAKPGAFHSSVKRREVDRCPHPRRSSTSTNPRFPSAPGSSSASLGE